MKFSHRSVPNRKAALDVAIESMSVPQSRDDASPEWFALLAATEASTRAGKTRSALGGYVPKGHPNHPSKWSAERRHALEQAELEVIQATEALRVAALAHANRAQPSD